MSLPVTLKLDSCFESMQDLQTKGLNLEPRILLEEQIGSGATSIVYKGTQLGVEKKPVAIKLFDFLNFPFEYNLLKDVYQREISYYQMMSVQGLNVAPELIASGEISLPQRRIPYLVTSYEGESLLSSLQSQLISDEENLFVPLDLESSLYLMHAIAEKISLLRESRIIHRDVKPGNILLNDGDLKLTDYGSATIFTSEGLNTVENLSLEKLFHSTRGYISPESYNHGRVSLQNDVYSAGVIFGEVLTGKSNYGMKLLGNLETYVKNFYQNNQDVSDPAKLKAINLLMAATNPYPYWRLTPEQTMDASKRIISEVSKPYDVEKQQDVLREIEKRPHKVSELELAS